MTLSVSARNLEGLAQLAAVPSYDRRTLTPGIVHIGVGNFHRAHQAVYLDDLAGAGNRDWGLIGVSLRRVGVHEALTAQDGLYTVVSRSAGPEESGRIAG